MSARPLEAHSLDQLESFAREHWDDASWLHMLAVELTHRTAPRAVMLYGKVAARLPTLVASVRMPAHPDAPPGSGFSDSDVRQSELFRAIPSIGASTPSTPSPAAGSPAPAASTRHPPVAPKPVPARAVPEAGPGPANATPAASSAAPAMTLEEACKLLKVSTATRWDFIELARRMLVQESSPTLTGALPAHQAAKLLERARRVNAAFQVLARSRQG